MGRRSQYPKRRMSVLRAIDDLTKSNGRSPSVRELSDCTEVPLGTLHEYLHKLESEGVLQWRRKGHRSLMLTPTGLGLLKVDAPF